MTSLSASDPPPYDRGPRLVVWFPALPANQQMSVEPGAPKLPDDHENNTSCMKTYADSMHESSLCMNSQARRQ
ncbi:hypothetical protein Dda_4829 [Drechslerella dactyloides]|uniref:Uncharacterized protein n=1 Tax=Drechslerella dactyloides TaxID=74499 RepID=A0AAD6NKZ2_DREDA|nr:hypothetical protein Dda_4829 [Drechslerella dactyloides]